jgi:Uma2 family endonuclease
MTAEEFGLKHAGDHVEYIDGQVKEVPMAGSKHGKVCFEVAFALGQHVKVNDLGHIFTNDTFVKTPTPDDPERVYGPDVCYASYTRLAKDAEIPAGILPVTPELVVEVKSPRDTWAFLFGRMGDYLNAGVPVVLILDPERNTASTYRNDEANPQEIFKTGDTLALPDVLPGFSVLVGQLFE